MNSRRIAFALAFVLLAACGQGASASPASLEDPVGDLTDAFEPTAPCEKGESFDMATLTVIPNGENFTVEVGSHTGGEIRQIKVVATAPNGDWYEFRGRADGNHTVDGGGPYAWERLSEFQVSLSGGGTAYSMTVSGLTLGSGWAIRVTTVSACADVAEVTVG